MDKYAVYMVLIEDTAEAVERLAQVTDSVVLVQDGDNLDYEDALELLKG